MTKVTIVETSPDDTIPVQELKPGQVGVITHWGFGVEYCGNVVKRTYRGGLEALGGEVCWDKEDVETFDDRCRVRVLPNGTMLKVEDNE